MGVKKIVGKVVKRAVTWNDLPFGTVVVAAAGSSERMEGEDKLFASIRGLPVIGWTLRALQKCENIHEIVVVTREESIVPIADLCAELEIAKATKIVRGGETRLDSVLIGVGEADPQAQYIGVHDAARPLVTEDIVKDAFRKAYKYHAACPAVPVTDTVKAGRNGFVTETPDRKSLFAVQTPQVFSAEVLKAALHNAKLRKLEITDDCGAAEAIGISPALSLGSYENIKITRPLDLKLAEAIAEERLTK